MKISWEFDLKSQVNRYADAVGSTINGFYQSHRFYILPFMPEKFRDRVVLLPLTNYLKRSVGQKKIVKINKQEHGEIITLTKSFYEKRKTVITKLEEDYCNTINMACTKILTYFPEAKNIKVVIKPSLWGSVGSYSLDKNKILITPRYDRSIENVYMLLVTALTHHIKFGHNNNLDNNPKTWRQKQLMASGYHIKLGFTERPQGMVTILDNSYSANLALESRKYCKKLGLSFKSTLKEKPLNSLSPKEKDLLSYLLENNNSIVNFDDIARVIWNDKADQKFSLYAITKTIERLRKKLKAAGFEENFIHTQRGVGYFLFD
jgi:hypothetical protein